MRPLVRNICETLSQMTSDKKKVILTSMKTACALFVPLDGATANAIVPGSIPWRIAEATIAPISSAMTYKTNLRGPMTPVRNSAVATFGLKTLPDTR